MVVMGGAKIDLKQEYAGDRSWIEVDQKGVKEGASFIISSFDTITIARFKGGKQDGLETVIMPDGTMIETIYSNGDETE